MRPEGMEKRGWPKNPHPASIPTQNQVGAQLDERWHVKTTTRVATCRRHTDVVMLIHRGAGKLDLSGGSEMVAYLRSQGKGSSACICTSCHPRVSSCVSTIISVFGGQWGFSQCKPIGIKLDEDGNDRPGPRSPHCDCPVADAQVPRRRRSKW